jgi:hypothetical protein
MARPSEAVLNARRAKDVAAVGYLGAAILGLMIVFSVSHWLGQLFQRRRPKNAGRLTKFARQDLLFGVVDKVADVRQTGPKCSNEATAICHNPWSWHDLSSIHWHQRLCRCYFG